MRLAYKKKLPQIINKGVKMNKRVSKISIIDILGCPRNMTTSPKETVN